MSEFRLETDRLVLRAWREADRDPFFALNSDPTVMEFLPTTDRVVSDTTIDCLTEAQERDGCCFWAVEHQADGKFLGFCGLMAPRAPLTEFEAGWRLSRNAWGHGFATEAARASLAWGWANLDAPSIVAITVPPNRRSRAVMDRIGMVFAQDEDFDHPSLPAGDPLSHHVLYRIARPL